MRVAEQIADKLASAGIRHAFGIPGGEILTLIDALADAGIAFVTARHETAAGLMAEGASVHGGAPALLVVTVGPGLSNAVNAVAHAFLDRVPMIVISGATDPEARAQFTHQVFDQRALLAPITKAQIAVDRSNAADSVAQALRLALSHPCGPVHLDLPVGVARADVLGAPFTESADAAPASSESLQWSAAAEILQRAERPLVLLGLESATADVSLAFTEFLAAYDAPVLSTYKAKGVLDERDPRALGAIALSPRADALVRPLLAQADVVLLVGYDPVEMRMSYARPFAAETRVIELAACPRSHGMHEAELVSVAPLAQQLRALAALLRGRSFHAHWPDGAPARVRDGLAKAFAPSLETTALTPESVVAALSRLVPSDVPMTVDTGAHRITLSQAFHARRPRQLLQSNGLCTMGYALPAAIGLAHASQRHVIAVMGDGGFEMVLGELATLRDLAAPVTLVIFDDQSLALIDMKQAAEGFSRNAVWLGATDHVALAHAFGGRGVRVHDVAGLDIALREALAAPQGFRVISCALERGAYTGRI